MNDLGSHSCLSGIRSYGVPVLSKAGVVLQDTSPCNWDKTIKNLCQQTTLVHYLRTYPEATVPSRKIPSAVRLAGRPPKAAATRLISGA